MTGGPCGRLGGRAVPRPLEKRGPELLPRERVRDSAWAPRRASEPPPRGRETRREPSSAATLTEYLNMCGIAAGGRAKVPVPGLVAKPGPENEGPQPGGPGIAVWTLLRFPDGTISSFPS